MFELKENAIKISVRNLVEFVFREGDIRSGRGALVSEKTMEAGNKIHRKIQKSMPLSYKAEVSLKSAVMREGYEILLEGRADGIDIGGDEPYIDEIKGTYRKLHKLDQPDYVHLAQALCYGYIYCKEHNLSSIGIQITYCHMETEEIRRFKESYSIKRLTEWFYELMDRFGMFADILFRSHNDCIRSARNLSFPFTYRDGQKEMTASVYYAIREKKKMFVQAPTGVGKTISTMFPAVKALGEEKASRIFYLTAKTITRTVAEETAEILQKRGLTIRSITLTAKDKLCVCEKRDCNPEACERAKGHFDRVNDAVYDIISNETKIDRDIILSYSEKHQVCPYELSLDVSYFTELIICDYNYVFDPKVRLKRYFSGGKGDYLFLIDETHNLIDRAREMYSAVLFKKPFLEAKKYMKELDKRVFSRLTDANKKMLELKKQCEGFTLLTDVDSLYLSLVRLKTEMDRFLEEEIAFEEKDHFMDLYFQVSFFLTVYENLDDCYRIYGEYSVDDFFIKLYCIQPYMNLESCMTSAVSTIFFSATILPIDYYKKILCGNKEEMAVYIPSPFSEKNRHLLIGNDVTTLYSRRGKELNYRIYLHLIAMITAKRGNYIAFFPSYQLMEQVVELFYDEGYPSHYKLLIQDSTMAESEKENFLKEFDQGPILAFCVLGGVFSEGIDLTGDRLIGAAIVGTGLPQVCSERNMLRDYYNENGEDGFSFAYLYPGMNKVLQAAGRVIRTVTDEGVLLLLDDRFLRADYQNLFPAEWNRYVTVNRYNTKRACIDFWKDRNHEV